MFKFCFVSLLRFIPQTLLCNLDNVQCFANCLRTLLRAWNATFVSHLILITSLIKTICSKKSTCSFYPDITIFSVILRQYRYIYRRSRYNDLIPLLPWHIVISGFHCISAPKSQLEVELQWFPARILSNLYLTWISQLRFRRDWSSLLII